VPYSDKSRIAWGLLPNRIVAGIDESQEPTVSYLGGMRFGGYNATWPFVRLHIFRRGLRLQSSTRLLRGLIPTWAARFDEIKEVQAIGSIKWVTTGIRFRTGEHSDWIVFWTIHRGRVLESLREMGLNVETRPVRLHFWNAGR
jgi:hypothetical protein